MFGTELSFNTDLCIKPGFELIGVWVQGGFSYLTKESEQKEINILRINRKQFFKPFFIIQTSVFVLVFYRKRVLLQEKYYFIISN